MAIDISDSDFSDEIFLSNSSMTSGLSPELRQDLEETPEAIYLDDSVVYDYLMKGERVSRDLNGTHTESFEDIDKLLTEYDGEIFIPDDSKIKAISKYTSEYMSNDDISSAMIFDRFEILDENTESVDIDDYEPDSEIKEIDADSRDQKIAEASREHENSVLLAYDDDLAIDHQHITYSTPGKVLEYIT